MMNVLPITKHLGHVHGVQQSVFGHGHMCHGFHQMVQAWAAEAVALPPTSVHSFSLVPLTAGRDNKCASNTVCSTRESQ